MKIFAFIMAFLVLALSVMPCMDDSDAVNGKANTAISKTADQQDQDHSDTDDCSPFCNCSCCSAPVINQAYVLSCFQKPVFLEIKYSPFTPSFYSSIASSIWQPPKLA